MPAPMYMTNSSLIFHVIGICSEALEPPCQRPARWNRNMTAIRSGWPPTSSTG